MSEEIKKITKDTLVPITMVLGLAGGIFYLGVLATQIRQNTNDIKDMRSFIQATPTQYQFSTLQESINDVRADIKDLKKTVDEIRK